MLAALLVVISNQFQLSENYGAWGDPIIEGAEDMRVDASLATQEQCYLIWPKQRAGCVKISMAEDRDFSIGQLISARFVTTRFRVIRECQCCACQDLSWHAPFRFHQCS